MDSAVKKTLLKDEEYINQKSHLNFSLKILADIIKKADGVGDDRKALVEKLLNDAQKEKEHRPNHSGCSGCTNDTLTEKRICRCMFYFMKEPEKCNACSLRIKWKNIGEIKIVDYERPTRYVMKHVGGMDLIINDSGQLYAVEVKPRSSTETLARMFAEILTYTVGLHVGDGKNSIKPAICFFEGSEQMRQYMELVKQKNEALLYIKQFVKIYYFKVKKDFDSEIAEFQICDIEHYNEKYGSGTNLRERLTEIIEQYYPIPPNKRDVMHKFYYQKYEDNLIRKMDEVHVAEYKKGSGGEMESQKSKPAKMASITSSSAMTFNILDNCTVELKKNQWFTAGRYSVQYEKQMYTLNKGSNPANLDALLINSDDQEVVFCEMKMLEWLGKPKALKEAYLDPDYYFCAEAYEVFSKIAQRLIRDKAFFSQYDAWQMFKHTLAIYNYTSFHNRENVNRKNVSESMAGEFKKVTLANVVFEMDEALIVDEELRKQYLMAVNREREEAAAFIRVMLASEYGLVELFRKNCDIEFHIIYLPVREFVACMEKSEEERAALGRYC